jgi:hypothetical protein
MKTNLASLAVAALLVVGPACSSFADDVPAPQTPAAPTAQAPAETPPPSVPRPSIAPKAAEPAAAPAADAEPLPPPHRHYAYHHRHWHRHYAYWQPFGPIMWPHLHHNGRIYWSRTPWFVGL